MNAPEYMCMHNGAFVIYIKTCCIKVLISISTFALGNEYVGFVYLRFPFSGEEYGSNARGKLEMQKRLTKSLKSSSGSKHPKQMCARVVHLESHERPRRASRFVSLSKSKFPGNRCDSRE